MVVFPTRAPQYISKISNKQELQLSSASPKAKKTLRAFIDNGRAYILGQMLTTTRRPGRLLTRLLTQKEQQQQLRKILWVFNCNVHFRFHNVYFPCWSLLLPSYLTILLLYNFVKTEHNRWWERTIIDTSLLVWKAGSDHLQSKFKFQNNWVSSFMKKIN